VEDNAMASEACRYIGLKSETCAMAILELIYRG